MFDADLFENDPRSYALEIAEVIGAEAVLSAVLASSSHDDVRGALDANELSPRFDEDFDEDE